jgi:hypothetical protein
VPERDPNPPEAVIVERLRKANELETEPVIALVGFVGPGQQREGEERRDVRLYPDLEVQRWMDFPQEDIVHSEPLDPAETGRGGRTPVTGRHVVWVDAEKMMEPVFAGETLPRVDQNFAGSAMSTWQFFPATRYVAAQFLDLIPSGELAEE